MRRPVRRKVTRIEIGAVMPSIYMHEYIAVAALGRRECEASPAALALGAYGPDALYYHDPLAAGRRAARFILFPSPPGRSAIAAHREVPALPKF